MQSARWLQSAASAALAGHPRVCAGAVSRAWLIVSPEAFLEELGFSLATFGRDRFNELVRGDVKEKNEEPDPDLQLAFDFEHWPTEKDHDC